MGPDPLRFRPEVFLSFSKKNGNLLRIAYKARELAVEMRKEHLFSEFKTFGGLLLPTKLVDMKEHGNLGKYKAAEWTVKDYKFPGKLPEEDFAKPEKK